MVLEYVVGIGGCHGLIPHGDVKVIIPLEVCVEGLALEYYSCVTMPLSVCYTPSGEARWNVSFAPLIRMPLALEPPSATGRAAFVFGSRKK